LERSDEVMFQRGDQVIYGIHGVCKIIDLEVRSINRKKIEYYVLEPVEQPGSRFYIPTQNEAAVAKLRHLITPEELDELLNDDVVRADAWIPDENQRKQRYRDLINSGDRAALICMVHTLHKHKQTQLASGRKFHLCDESFLKDAIKLLNAEFALVLNMEQEKVGVYIQNALKIE